MKKTQLDNKIALITTGGLNTAAEAVDIWNKTSELLFGVPTFQSHGAPGSIIDQPFNTGTFQFEFLITAVGGGFTIEGFLKNISQQTLSDLNVARFTNSDYFPIDTDAPSTSDPHLTRFTGRTPIGTLVNLAVGWVDISGILTPVFRCEGVISPNTSSISQYNFGPQFIQTKQ